MQANVKGEHGRPVRHAGDRDGRERGGGEREAAMTWTVDQLGQIGAGGDWFAYPRTVEGITIKVSGEDAEEVVSVANAIESLITAQAVRGGR